MPWWIVKVPDELCAPLEIYTERGLIAVTAAQNSVADFADARRRRDALHRLARKGPQVKQYSTWGQCDCKIQPKGQRKQRMIHMNIHESCNRRHINFIATEAKGIERLI